MLLQYLSVVLLVVLDSAFHSALSLSSSEMERFVSRAFRSSCLSVSFVACTVMVAQFCFQGLFPSNIFPTCLYIHMQLLQWLPTVQLLTVCKCSTVSYDYEYKDFPSVTVKFYLRFTPPSDTWESYTVKHTRTHTHTHHTHTHATHHTHTRHTHTRTQHTHTAWCAIQETASAVSSNLGQAASAVSTKDQIEMTGFMLWYNIYIYIYILSVHCSVLQALQQTPAWNMGRHHQLFL